MSDWFTADPISLVAIALSAVAVYAAVLVYTRLAGLRSFAKMSSFDFAMTVAIGSMLAASVLNRSVALPQALVGIGMIFALQIGVGWARRRWNGFQHLVDNEPLLLMDGDEMLWDHMKKVQVTEDDLWSEAPRGQRLGRLPGAGRGHGDDWRHHRPARRPRRDAAPAAPPHRRPRRRPRDGHRRRPPPGTAGRPVVAEGHAVIRWARRLAPLVGEPLVHVQMPKRWGERPAGLVGQRLLEPVTRGKHLLLPLSGGETLHCHGAQYGSWQVGERPMDLRKEPKHVRLRLDTADHEAVFFHGPTVELLTAGELAAHERLNALGPDVMAPTADHQPGGTFDRAEAARRIRQRAAEHGQAGALGPARRGRRRQHLREQRACSWRASTRAARRSR